MYWRKSSPGWQINYLNDYSETERLWDGLLWKNWVTFSFFFFLSAMGDKGNPTRWKSTPPDKHNDNNFLTIWCLLHPPVAIQTKSSPRKKIKNKKTCSNMVLRVYSDHTICFLKSTFKTALWAVPTALSLKLGLTPHSPLCYLPSV